MRRTEGGRCFILLLRSAAPHLTTRRRAGAQELLSFPAAGRSDFKSRSSDDKVRCREQQPRRQGRRHIESNRQDVREEGTRKETRAKSFCPSSRHWDPKGKRREEPRAVAFFFFFFFPSFFHCSSTSILCPSLHPRCISHAECDPPQPRGQGRHQASLACNRPSTCPCHRSRTRNWNATHVPWPLITHHSAFSSL